MKKIVFDDIINKEIKSIRRYDRQENHIPASSIISNNCLNRGIIDNNFFYKRLNEKKLFI